MKNIKINATNEFHLLRHFSSVDKEYIKSLLGQEYYYHDNETNTFKSGIISSIDIKHALQTKGSKFFDNILGIENPKRLLLIINKEFKSINKKWKPCTNGKYIDFLIEYFEPVGYKNLVPVNSLTDEEKKKVIKVGRGRKESSVIINEISNIDMKKLNTIEVGVLNTEELPFLLVTAYPGDLTKTIDFPSKSQTKEDYEKSVKFWNEHVFVNLNT